MKSFVISITTILSIFTNSAFAVSTNATCTAAPSGESANLSLAPRPGTSSYEGKVTFKSASYEFTVMSRPTGLTVGTNIGDTVIIADSQNSTTGTTLVLASQSNPSIGIKVTCTLN